jgi:bacterioferritin-associated ferredoxin
VVTHCICARRSFADVLQQARSAGWVSVEELERQTGCGARCGLCRPYLQATLETGETRFRVGGYADRPAMAAMAGG